MAPSSVGRPPDARKGKTVASGGRTVVAGVGSHLRPTSPRATISDLWATLDIAAAGGTTSLQRRGAPSLDPAATRRLSAYVRQSRQYYDAVPRAEAAAKPLLAYYFMLNLTKAYLTASNPPSTVPPKLMHGLGDEFKASARYRFTQEKFKIHKEGVFRLLAESTGMGHCWPKGTVLQVSDLLPFLVESGDLYSEAAGRRPKLMRVQRTQVRATGTGPNQEAWLVVDVSRLQLRQANVGAAALVVNAAVFGDHFRLVTDGADSETATYESRSAIKFTTFQKALPQLSHEFDSSIICRDRTRDGGTDFIVMSPKTQLLSMEALSFATMHHLSNMVRYRPHHVEFLRGGKYWWLFTSWVDRACENFLLALSSRISLEEHVIG